MELKRQEVKCRCDMGICRNNADYVVTGEGIMPHRRLHLCQQCAKELYEALGREFVPKGLENVVRRAEKRRCERI